MQRGDERCGKAVRAALPREGCYYISSANNISRAGVAFGDLRELARVTDKRIVFYCAFGERSTMAVQDAGLASARHVEGGIDAWKKAGGTVVG